MLKTLLQEWIIPYLFIVVILIYVFEDDPIEAVIVGVFGIIIANIFWWGLDNLSGKKRDLW